MLIGTLISLTSATVNLSNAQVNLACLQLVLNNGAIM